MRVCRKYGRKRGGKIGKEKENRHNRGRITRAIILRVRGRPLPTSSFSVSSSFYSSSTSSLATPAALVSVHLLVSCLARFSSIFLPRRRRSSQSRTSRRCVIRIFFAQMTPDPPLGEIPQTTTVARIPLHHHHHRRRHRRRRRRRDEMVACKK